ncbi:hypothetical protein BACOVA_02657 [Bacteroides ovatus ATCC 8483]|uniref:Uncharacterized protein n=1 Tax=Bacteroides ovatus (strain ATCC 8483 / DSM 1896 / JCM 5824 / BCRC 10623 / CCUG 4943 / NCTC 11153) TaxID=411476 RepID=A0AAN3D998_BACO1|nr:hypothetical protein BACOVA_02657 [Bacteroides ovatus ATCC 8483]
MLGSGFIPVIMGFLNVFCARETLAIHNPIKINKSLQLFFIILIFKVCTDGKVHHNPAETRFVMFQGAERFLSG